MVNGTGIEVLRIPIRLPKRPKIGATAVGGVLAVPALTVVLGAAVVPGPGEEAKAERVVKGFKVTVDVDGALVLSQAPVFEVLGEAGTPIMYRDDNCPPVVVTPREEGVEVEVVLFLRGKVSKAFQPGAAMEVWLYVAR